MWVGAGGSRDMPQVMQALSGCLSPCCKFWDPKTQVQIHHTFLLSSASLTSHLVICSLVDFLSPHFRCWLFLILGNTVTWLHWPGTLKLLATGMQQSLFADSQNLTPSHSMVVQNMIPGQILAADQGQLVQELKEPWRAELVRSQGMVTRHDRHRIAVDVVSTNLCCLIHALQSPSGLSLLSEGTRTLM